MRKARILVVEDEELVALAIKTYLERIGYEVPAITATGEEAMERFREIAPDLVLMDIRLDGKMSGIVAAGLIKNSFHVPVIYLTAYSDADTLEMAKLTEPFGYVLKPFDERALQVTIKMALHKASVQEELRRSKEKLTDILQSVGDGILVTSPVGTIEYANATAHFLLGIASPLPPSVSALRLLSALDSKTRVPIAIPLERVAARGESADLRGCILSAKDGKSCLVDVRVEPYRAADGTIKGTVLTFRDMSERNKIQELIAREMESAADFHKSLLPKDDIEQSGFRMSGFLIPATYGAGDIYNFFSIDERHLGLYIIDVMGHGVAATSIVLLLSRLLSPDPAKPERLPLLDADPRAPRRVVEKLNELFHGGGEQMFFTICYGVIDRGTGKLTLVRAGHPYPILQKAGGALQEIRPGGYAVGLARYIDATETEVILEPGDKLFLYSDGLTECADARSIRFSREKLIFIVGETISRKVRDAAARVKKEVIEWRGKDSFDDDVSLMAIEMVELELL
jgi:serine phosphatase RsbU (regulator of sigma subunit)/CheY-like chemotaxis protein